MKKNTISLTKNIKKNKQINQNKNEHLQKMIDTKQTVAVTENFALGKINFSTEYGAIFGI